MNHQIDQSHSPFSLNTLTNISQLGQDTNKSEPQTCCDRNCCGCFNHWWNSKFAHQQFIVHTVEKTAFHVAIIVLVLLDCALVVGELLLDFIILNEKCKDITNHTRSSSSQEHGSNSKLELAVEILHFGSIFLLSIFVVEVIIKIYGFGKHWWDIREKKMEWLDALIVIVSFGVDIYFQQKPSVIGEISLLFISFRLWRIIRIINSVAQSIRSKDETAKKGLAETYTQIIELLLNVSSKKTEAISELRNNLRQSDFDQMVTKFTSIDNSCWTTLQNCPKPSSRNAVTDLAQHLEEVLKQIRISTSSLTAAKH